MSLVNVLAATINILTYNTHHGKDQTVIIVELFGTKSVGPPTDRNIYTSQGFNKLSFSVWCSKTSE